MNLVLASTKRPLPTLALAVSRLAAACAFGAPFAVHGQESRMGFEHLEGVDVAVAFDDPTADRVLEAALRQSLGRRMGINLIVGAQPNAFSVAAVATCVPEDCASAEFYSVALLLSNHYDAAWALDLLSRESPELADLYAPRVSELTEPLGIWAEAWRSGEYRVRVDAFVDRLEAGCFAPALARRGILAALAIGDSVRARELDRVAGDERALC